jgi:NAD+ synthase (glutamine-hydrolysing)
MECIGVGGVALNQTPLDWNGNRDRILLGLDLAREAGLAVVCFPELAVSGYGCEDAFLAPGIARTALDVLFEIAPASRGLVAAVGLPVWFESGVYDCVCLLVDGRPAGLVAKRHLAGEGIHYEPRWFRPWPDGRRERFRAGGVDIPLGDLRFDCGGVRIGFEICEDAWVAARPGATLADRGVDLILNPSASHFAFGKESIRERLVTEGSRAFGAAYVYTNLLGNEAGRAVYDGSVLVAVGGRIVAAGRRFAFEDVALTGTAVDLDLVRLAQVRLGQSQAAEAEHPPRRTGADEVEECLQLDYSLPPCPSRLAVGRRRDAWEHGPFVKEEEFTRAVSLGLFDYARKSRSRGFVVSTSGGADSSAVACLVAMAVRLAAADRGVAETRACLGLDAPGVSPDPSATTGLGPAMAMPSGSAGDPLRAAVTDALVCVYQSTENSGPVTRAAARGLAAALGATYHEFDVQSQVVGYRVLVEKAIGRPLDWSRDDIALQNVQARARSPGAWMLANVLGGLLLSTSNRSEAAVGYATMDGDTSGGIAPVAGIDKAFLRRWLEWCGRTGPQGLGPIAALAAVYAQEPTAELRPSSAGQTDEADLMPYDVLDAAERAAIRDKRMPLETWRQLVDLFPGYDPARLAFWTERFYRLWSRNQWKRERYAPSFHLDDENLDPRSWCRFPILSGGYERELADLRRVADV